MKPRELKMGDPAFKVATQTNELKHFIAVDEVIKKNHIMAHVNPAFVIASSELEINYDQDRHSAGKLGKGTRTVDPEAPNQKKGLKAMVKSKWKWSWAVNGLIVFSLVIVVVALEMDLVSFRALGYQCNDPKLSHRYRGDTVSFGLLIAMSIMVPVFVICLLEVILMMNQGARNSWKKKVFCQIMRWYGHYFFGLLFLLFVIQIGKSIIAEPRPHFFETCRPNKMNCTGYITNYKCTNEILPEKFVKDSVKSFPSGHASVGWYLSVFMSLFIHLRVPPTSYLIVPFFHCITLAWGLLCSLTRITDHRHHWWDVLAGTVVGIFVAVFTVKVFCKNFNTCTFPKTRRQEKFHKDSRSSSTWYKKFLRKSRSSAVPPGVSTHPQAANSHPPAGNNHPPVGNTNPPAGNNQQLGGNGQQRAGSTHGPEGKEIKEIKAIGIGY